MFVEMEEPPTRVGPHRIQVFGHEAVLAGLRRSVADGRVAQAVLLAGPPGVGKRTVARWLAQVLACAVDDVAARPCGHCRACRLVAAGGWPDLYEAPVPLRIDAARGLQHDLALAPAEGAHRLALLPEVELASAGAANSLLKTLEEPPRQVVLVLTTADLGAVLPTVRSRCQVLALRPLPPALVEAALIKCWGGEPEQAALLARLSGGRLGWAGRALADRALLADRQVWLDSLARARAADLPGRLAVAADLARAATGLAEGLAAWSSWWRDVLLAAHGLAELVTNRDRLAEIEAAARRYAPAEVLGCLRGIEMALRRLAANAGSQLTLEVLMLEMPQ
jgi:DNA polymerase III subunit delta'